jgi:RNA polymerase sigma-70 factor, ECF subfamily
MGRHGWMGAQMRTVDKPAASRPPASVAMRPPLSAGTDDAALVARAQQDRESFALLYDRYLDRIYRFCYRRLDSREAAEDATSAVFTKALTALGTYQERPGGFRAWIFTIAHNVVTDVYRDRGRRPSEPLADDFDVVDSDPSPEDAAVASDERRRLRALLTHLTPDQQQVIELRLEGLSGAEIGEILGRSRGAINLAQHRAVRRLQRVVGRSDDAEPPENTARKGGDL